MGLAKTFLLRYALLLLIAFCLFLILESEDRNVRLAAVISLIIFEQLRDWSSASVAASLAKGNKPSRK